MRARSGFTLVEVMVALVVAALLGIAVAGSVRAAVDTRDRLEARRLEVRSGLAWRGLVEATLANARPPAAPDDTAFLLVDRALPGGRPADRLVLLAAGSLPPLHPGLDWVVSLEAAEDGLRLMAAPVGVRAEPVRVRAPGGLTGLDVEALEPGGAWVREWTTPLLRPAAVRVTFWTDDGAAPDPLTVWIPPLEMPR